MCLYIAKVVSLFKILKYFTTIDYDTIVFINSDYKYSKYIIQLLLASLFICNIVFCFNVCENSKTILILTTNMNIMLSRYFMTKKKEKDDNKDIHTIVEEGYNKFYMICKDNHDEMKKKDETIRNLLYQLNTKKDKIRELKIKVQNYERKLSNYKKFDSKIHSSSSAIRFRNVSKSK